MPENEPILIPLKWGKVDQAETIYANQIFIYTSGTEHYLAFGEVRYDPTIDRENPPEFIEVEPLIKIVTTADKIKEFAQIITHYLKSRGELE